jgi:hypothetical protein
MGTVSRGFVAQLVALVALAAVVAAGTALLITAVLFLLAPR